MVKSLSYLLLNRGLLSWPKLKFLHKATEIYYDSNRLFASNIHNFYGLTKCKAKVASKPAIVITNSQQCLFKNSSTLLQSMMQNNISTRRFRQLQHSNRLNINGGFKVQSNHKMYYLIKIIQNINH